MGCVSSKKARSESESPTTYVVPAAVPVRTSSANAGRANGAIRLSSSGPVHVAVAFGPLEKIKEEPEKEVEVDEENEESVKRRHDDHHSGILRAAKGSGSHKRSAFSFKIGRLTEGEHVAAGWPAWLSAAAAEAIDGWLLLRSDTYERLEKIGQGTYSNVYRARDVETGKMVALKKVRFDNFQPESVRFMAREILILRKLDHPNVMKLEGIITSRLSYSLYLVFEYMEHDLSGLLLCPDIKFTDSQIKCYMKQLLSGIEHCHSRGIMHRDIKSSNILVNNEGVLKIADFGLANFVRPRNNQPLTSRVVTLWYRPPELLLGSMNYGESVDLWSVGCVFAELFVGRPLLKGRTEVEQLHKIFKLCGSPPDEFWKKCKLPLATMFKPQHPYESTLRERCKEFPKSAVSLIETFLSFEPQKRGTASSALHSEYFTTKPYACDPSRLPKYPPNKEINAKFREEAKRKRTVTSSRAQAVSRNSRSVCKNVQESTEIFKVVPTEEVEANIHVARRNHGGTTNVYRRRGGLESRTSLKQPYDTMSEASQMTLESNTSSIQSVPAQVTGSSGFAWAKRQKEPDIFTRLHAQHNAASRNKRSSVLHSHNTLESDRQESCDSSRRARGHESTKRAMREQVMLQRPDSFDSSEIYETRQSSGDYGSTKKKGRVAFSGPLIHQSDQEMTSKQYSQPRQIHRSRFYKDF